MDPLTLAVRAMAGGWSYECIPLYDEEAVDGYLWRGPNGEEECCLQDDVVPDRFVLEFGDGPAKGAANELADFLEKLLFDED